MDNGVGSQIWFCFCIVVTIGNLIRTSIERTTDITIAVPVLIGVFGYILLLLSKRVGYLLILILVILSVAAGVDAGLTGYEASVFLAATSFLSFVNPLITWLIIRKSWKE